MSTIEWPPETDAFLHTYAEYMTKSALHKCITSDNSEPISSYEIVSRCEQLGLEVGKFSHLNPRGIENHFPALPKGFERKEWDGGVSYRCHLDPKTSGGYCGVVICNARGHAETSDRRYAQELLGGEDSD